jgi:hypothetical protein
MPESGAIPKRSEADAVPQSSCAQDSSIPSLQGLRADAAAAASMVEALDLGGTGNFSSVPAKATKRSMQ